MDKYKMKEEEEDLAEPVSPTGQYLNSSVLCVYVIGVLELEIPLNDSQRLSLLRDVFLPMNPRFSSIMINGTNGEKKWKQVEVKLEEHINIPKFPNNSPNLYDEDLDDYISKIALEKLPESRPLWDIHIIKYPTSNAASTVIFKIHHALGDGYSLMGALLSCLQRVDDPSLPLTFPSMRKAGPICKIGSIFKGFSSFFPIVFNTLTNFGWSVLKSSLVEDDITPIRSGNDDMKLRHVTISNVSFPLDQIKEVKSKLGVGTNDVAVGIIFFGIRLYMQEIDQRSTKAKATGLVLLNTRNTIRYTSVKEMVSSSSTAPWGNRFAFLHTPIPQLNDEKMLNPLEFVWEAHKAIKMKKDSLDALLNAVLLETVNKFRGSEAAAKFVYSTLRNSSATISSMMGPVEKMALNNHPIKGVYFMVAGPPESISITIMSYMGTLRIAFGMEKGFIDPQKFKSCMENSHEMILEAAQIPRKIRG